MKNIRITKELFRKCSESKRIPRKLKKFMKLTLYSVSMHADSVDMLGPYVGLMSAFSVIELLKDAKKISTND